MKDGALKVAVALFLVLGGLGVFVYLASMRGAASARDRQASPTQTAELVPASTAPYVCGMVAQEYLKREEAQRRAAGSSPGSAPH